MRDSDHLYLPDGRRLEVRVSGPDGGLPLVFHHGTPGCRSRLRFLEQAVHARGVRFVTTSRPGYGGSSRQPGRNVADVVDDTRAVLASLGADRCLVAGWSGGGPHALACAARLEGVLGALSIAGVAPYGSDDLDWLAGMGADNLDEFGAALRGEEVLRAYLEAQREELEGATAADIAAALASLLPMVDREVLTDEFGEDLAADFHEALSVGVDGWLDDDLAFTRPWGFDLAEVSIPTFVWQGGLDLMVPPAHGEWLARNLPGGTAHLVAEAGHLSIALGGLEVMLHELLGVLAES